MSNTTTKTAPITRSDWSIVSEEVTNPNVVFGTLKAYRVVIKGFLQPEVYFDQSDAVWAVTKLVLTSLHR